MIGYRKAHVVDSVGEYFEIKQMLLARLNRWSEGCIEDFQCLTVQLFIKKNLEQNLKIPYKGISV